MCHYIIIIIFMYVYRFRHLLWADFQNIYSNVYMPVVVSYILLLSDVKLRMEIV